MTIYLLLAGQLQISRPAEAQFGNLKKRLTQAVVCDGGKVGGYNLGDKLGEFQAKNMKLSPAETAAIKRKYEIGLAMALCNGGSAVANTTFAKLSDRDKKQRDQELNAAVADAAPSTNTYPVPDHPDMKEMVTGGR